MPRVTLNRAVNMPSLKQKGLKMFNYDMGNRYHIIFLAETVGQDEEGNDIYEPLQYRTVIHKIGPKKQKVRCSNIDNYQMLGPESVLRLDDEGKPLIDVRSGKPFNDGSCPYCKAFELSRQQIAQEWAEKEAAEPNISDADRKKFFKDAYSKQPVTDVEYHNAFMVAVLEMNNNKIVTDAEGNKKYEIMGMEMTESRFQKKLMEQVEVFRLGEEEGSTHDGLSWNEFYFNFPDSASKMESGKDMTISLCPRPVLATDKALFDKLKEEVERMDYDEVENMMFAFKLKSIEDMEKDLSNYMTITRHDMTDEEVEAAKDKVYKSDAVSVDEIKEIMQDKGGEPETEKVEQKTEETKPVKEDKPAEEVKGADLFTEDDISNLL